VLFHLLVVLLGGLSVPAPPTDNAERYIRPNPTDGGTVSARLRPTLPVD
jgi:hypothetical protein